MLNLGSITYESGLFDLTIFFLLILIGLGYGSLSGLTLKTRILLFACSGLFASDSLFMLHECFGEWSGLRSAIHSVFLLLSVGIGLLVGFQIKITKYMKTFWVTSLALSIYSLYLDENIDIKSQNLENWVEVAALILAIAPLGGLLNKIVTIWTKRGFVIQLVVVIFIAEASPKKKHVCPATQLSGEKRQIIFN